MNRYEKNFLLSLQNQAKRINLGIPFEMSSSPEESSFKLTNGYNYFPVKESIHLNISNTIKSKGELDKITLAIENINQEYWRKTVLQPKMKNDFNRIILKKQSDLFTQLYQVSTSNLDPVKLFYIKLKILFSDQSDSNELILDRILTEFSASELNCRTFCGTLMVVLCKRCLKNDSFDTSLFILRIFLLKKFLYKENTKLEALSAIRCLDDKVIRPKNFLSHVFTLLYEYEIIDFDIFLKWKKFNQKYHQSLKKLSNFFRIDKKF